MIRSMRLRITTKGIGKIRLWTRSIEAAGERMFGAVARAMLTMVIERTPVGARRRAEMGHHADPARLHLQDVIAVSMRGPFRQARYVWWGIGHLPTLDSVLATSYVGGRHLQAGISSEGMQHVTWATGRGPFPYWRALEYGTTMPLIILPYRVQRLHWHDWRGVFYHKSVRGAPQRTYPVRMFRGTAEIFRRRLQKPVGDHWRRAQAAFVRQTRRVSRI